MRVKQIKSDYKVIDFSDISRKYDPESTQLHGYSLFDFVSTELHNPHIIYDDDEEFHILYKATSLINKLTPLDYENNDLDYIRHQSDNFQKFVKDFERSTSFDDVWLDFGYWLNAGHVVNGL